MIALISFFLLLLNSVSGTKLSVVRQDSQRYGTIERYENGKVTATSNVVPYTFKWPHVELTSNTKDKEVYVITFPDTVSGPVLYLLDSDLQVKFTWQNIPYSFFDLQFSNKQDTLFGIYVSSTYGRVISRFNVNKQNSSDIEVKQIFTLPYMWYVNASSYQQSTETYYALINYFPGTEGYTADQQLVILDVSNGGSESVGNTYLIKPSDKNPQAVTVQFLGYSAAAKELFFAGTFTNTSTAIIGTFDLSNGHVKDVIWKKSASAVGPLVVDDAAGVITVYTKDTTGTKWSLWSVSQKTGKERLVEQYEVNADLNVFAAASIGF